jgi:SAM-dependent methyltransferase
MLPGLGVNSQYASYSSMPMGFASRARELSHLVHLSLGSQQPGVAHTIQTMHNVERRVLDLTGVRLRGLKVLEVGPGQKLRHLRYLALSNEAVGIDTDFIPQGSWRDVAELLASGPPMRSVKTLGRKLLGQDARFDAALAAALCVDRLPRVPVLKMGATRMTFADASFDFIFSCSVFEHIDDPVAALGEVRRVLKPGGVMYVSLHLYTSHSGQHDAAICATGKPQPPYWPHLRAKYQDTVREAAFLNRVRLAQWVEMFSQVMPGTRFINERQDDEIGDGLRPLREAGELAEYTDEELMTVNLVAVWKKPDACRPSSMAKRMDDLPRGERSRSNERQSGDSRSVAARFEDEHAARIDRDTDRVSAPRRLGTASDGA